jgi:hypothetical protein
MFKKMFSGKSKSNNSKSATLDKNALKNVVGGGDPVPGLDFNVDQTVAYAPYVSIKGSKGK